MTGGLRKISVIIGMLLLVCMIAACGGKATEQANSNTEKPQEASVQENKAENEAEAEGNTETTEAETGATPEQQEEAVARVVTLERSFADHLVALGIVPVGAIVRDGGDFEPYLADQMVDTESVGQSSTPNLEKILSLKPDLIIGTDKEHAQAEEALKQIAPTLIVGSDEMESDWRAVFMQLAEAVDKTELAQEEMGKFEDRILALKERLAPVIEGKTIAFVKVTNKDTRILGNLSPLGQIAYGQLGMKYPEGLEDEKNETKISIEALPEINPDYIFVMDTNVPKYEEALAETLETPIWKNLTAIKDEAYSMVPLRATKTGFGLIMHNLFLDYIEQGLLN